MDFNHHAYLIEGKNKKEALLKLLEKSGFKIKGNPDFYILETETFKIDQAREIESFQSRKNLSGDRQIILLSFDFITREAQNALLKTLEEPSLNTHFFILAPKEEMLLPTIISRVEKLEINSVDIVDLKEVKKFLRSTVSERIKMVDKIIKSKDKTLAKNFIDNLVIEFRKENKKINSEQANYLKSLTRFSGYLNDRSPSLKQILEYSAINLPEE